MILFLKGAFFPGLWMTYLHSFQSQPPDTVDWPDPGVLLSLASACMLARKKDARKFELLREGFFFFFEKTKKIIRNRQDLKQVLCLIWAVKNKYSVTWELKALQGKIELQNCYVPRLLLRPGVSYKMHPTTFGKPPYFFIFNNLYLDFFHPDLAHHLFEVARLDIA